MLILFAAELQIRRQKWLQSAEEMKFISSEMGFISSETVSKKAVFVFISEEMVFISEEMVSKKAVFDFISEEMVFISEEMVSKKAVFGFISEEMVFISSASWRLFGAVGPWKDEFRANTPLPAFPALSSGLRCEVVGKKTDTGVSLASFLCLSM